MRQRCSEQAGVRASPPSACEPWQAPRAPTAACLLPAHTLLDLPLPRSALLPRLHYFENGTCIVHHLFGGETCDIVRRAYGDAYLAAHFEVPGEMFRLAMEVGQGQGGGRGPRGGRGGKATCWVGAEEPRGQRGLLLLQRVGAESGLERGEGSWKRRRASACKRREVAWQRRVHRSDSTHTPTPASASAPALTPTSAAASPQRLRWPAAWRSPPAVLCGRLLWVTAALRLHATLPAPRPLCARPSAPAAWAWWAPPPTSWTSSRRR